MLLGDQFDGQRFVLGLELFNTLEPIGSIFAQSFKEGSSLSSPASKSHRTKVKLVDVVCYCFNPNHFHLLLRERVEGGITEFIKRLCGGYSSYFNHRNQRSGPLYQDRFQAKHINSNDYLLWVSAYVNLNDRVHQLSSPASKLVQSSWNQYVNTQVRGICDTGIILEQFTSPKRYERFALDALDLMQQRKDPLQVFAKLGVE